MSASLNKKGLWRPQTDGKLTLPNVWMAPHLRTEYPGVLGAEWGLWRGGVVRRLHSVQQRLSHPVGGRWMFVHRGNATRSTGYVNRQLYDNELPRVSEYRHAPHRRREHDKSGRVLRVTGALGETLRPRSSEGSLRHREKL